MDGRHPAGLLTSISYNSAGAVDYAIYGNNRELRRGYRPSTGQLQYHEIRNVDRPLTNAGFEEGSGTDASGWDEVLSASRSTERALTGKASMKIAAGWIGNATTSGYIPVQGSSTYTLSGYIYILYRHSGNIYLDLNDGNAQGQNITDVNLQANTSKVGVWQRVAGTFTTAPATTGVKVRIVYDGAQTDMSVVFYADEISITPGTSPPAAAWTYDYRDPNTPAGSTMLGIANAGFESGSGTNAYDWNQFGTSRTTTRAHSGSASLKVDHAVGSVLNAATASYIAVEGSTSYWLSAWVYVQSSSGGNLYLDLDDGHGQGEDFNDVTIAANSSLVGSWQHITGMFQTAAGTTGVKVRVVHASAASIVAYVDDLTLEKETADLEAPQNGMIQQIRDQVNSSYSETYSYDNLYRLVQAETSVWTASWAYDRSGNRLSQTTTGVSYSETLSISATSNRVNGWTYDAAGNVTNDGVHTYQYDAENRLIKIDNGSTAVYAYGPKGERVSKIAAGVTTYFYWGIGEKVGGQWTRLYVSGPGGKLVEYSGGTTWFFATNHLGTIAARMNVSGQTMETYRYLPYGERYAGTQTPHQYTGKERDAESGLDYFGARYLSSAHGRWMSVDPVVQAGDPQLLNRYAYVRNSPINYTDPNGGYLIFTAYQMALMMAYMQSQLTFHVTVTAPQPILIPTPPPVPSWSGGPLSSSVGPTAQTGGPGSQGGTSSSTAQASQTFADAAFQDTQTAITILLNASFRCSQLLSKITNGVGGPSVTPLMVIDLINSAQFLDATDPTVAATPLAQLGNAPSLPNFVNAIVAKAGQQGITLPSNPTVVDLFAAYPGRNAFAVPMAHTALFRGSLAMNPATVVHEMLHFLKDMDDPTIKGLWNIKGYLPSIYISKKIESECGM